MNDPCRSEMTTSSNSSELKLSANGNRTCTAMAKAMGHYGTTRAYVALTLTELFPGQSSAWGHQLRRRPLSVIPIPDKRGLKRLAWPVLLEAIGKIKGIIHLVTLEDIESTV